MADPPDHKPVSFGLEVGGAWGRSRRWAREMKVEKRGGKEKKEIDEGKEGKTRKGKKEIKEEEEGEEK